MIEVYLFELPIYRLPEDAYLTQRERHIKKVFDRVDPNNSFSDLRRDSIADRLRNQYGGAWRYNEIDGFVRLFILGDQIRGDLWTSSGKRRIKKRKKQFHEWQGKFVPEQTLPIAKGSKAIGRAIDAHVALWEKAVAPRVIDRHTFEATFQFVDWERLIESACIAFRKQIQMSKRRMPTRE